MLKSKTYKVGDVWSFKLVSGEELIATVKTIEDERIALSAPMTIGGDASGKPMFYPTSMFGGEDAVINVSKQAILFDVIPEKEYVTAYKPSKVIT